MSSDTLEELHLLILWCILNPPKAFSWLKLIHDSGMKGLTAMLASHSAPIFYDENVPHLKLEVHKSMRNFAENVGVKNVEVALKEHFGDGLVLEVCYGEAATSPSILAQERKINKSKNAFSGVMRDEFSGYMSETFGAKIIVESVHILNRRS